VIAPRWLVVLLAAAAASAGATAVAQLDPAALLAPPAATWPQHGRDPGATRFSPLDQVHRGNVADLRLAWVAELGFTGRVQGSPAVWGDGLYVSTEDGVRAFDAASGGARWEYVEDRNDRTRAGLPRQAPRGAPVVVPDRTGGAVVVVSLPSAPVVVALDAADGTVRWRTDVGDPDYAEALRTNPILAGDVLVVGPTGADLSPVPGRLVALRLEDGVVAWTFDLVPVREDDPARSTWSPQPPGRSFGVGGGSGWNAGAYDVVSDTVIYGTGQPVPSDRLDPRRYDGDGPVSIDLYTASFVALDATTGDLRWFHQVVPGDEWAYDQHTVPIVADVTIDGEVRRVAVLATTTGFVVAIDVATGAFLTAHAMVDGSTVHLGYEADGTPIIDPAMRRTSVDDVLRVCPGSRWANVAPGAFSPRTGLVYRPNDLACVQQGAGTTPDDWQPGARPTWLLSEARDQGDHYARWGALTAIDPATGAVAWSFDVAYPHDAGALATAGDLVFAAFPDRLFRAFDAATGEVLWSQVLTAHADGAPITYAVGEVQYVAVLAGRDTSVASLPESGLPATVTGPATLFVFALANAP
jgi:PQQ-dependent dehydrogenase (methanol/ethanol family)